LLGAIVGAVVADAGFGAIKGTGVKKIAFGPSSRRRSQGSSSAS